MRTFLIALLGNRTDIEDIQTAVKLSDWELITENDQYFLKTTCEDSEISLGDLTDHAKLFIDIANGCSKVMDLSHFNVLIGDIIEIDSKGLKTFHASIVESVRLRDKSTATLVSEGKLVEPAKSEMELILTLAKNDAAVRDALHFFNEVNWWNLYKVYEIIRDGTKSQGELYKLTEREKLSIFTKAAQSRDFIGDDARHASKNYRPPEITMTLEDAYNLISQLFKKWAINKSSHKISTG